MTDVEIRRPVPLRIVPGVELAAVGTWKAKTGTTTFTAEDFAHAVSALDCPGVRNPVIKLGHDEADGTGIRWDGEPAAGWIANMRLGNDGKLRGDFTGMPAWLADPQGDGMSVLASAYPDRSIEIHRPFVCQIGHTHPSVITAVALLGVSAPGVGVLRSMQDVYATYTAPKGTDPVYASAAHPMHTTVRLPIGDTMPAAVQASVSVEEISRKYYESAGYSSWITAMHVDPLELVTSDDATGKFYRVPVEVGAGGTFTFGEPQEVAIVYKDVKSAAAALPYRWQDRKAALSAQGVKPDLLEVLQTADAVKKSGEATDEQAKVLEAAAATAPIAPDVSPAGAAIRKVAAATVTAPDATPAAGSTPTEEEVSGVAKPDPTKLREALGLAADASDEDVRAALASAIPDAPPDALASPPADGDIDAMTTLASSGQAVLVDKAQLSQLIETARKGEIAYNQNRRNERDTFLSTAVREGRIPPASLSAYERLWDNDPEGTRKTVQLLARNIIPVNTVGFASADVDMNEADLALAAMYPGQYGPGSER